MSTSNPLLTSCETRHASHPILEEPYVLHISQCSEQEAQGIQQTITIKKKDGTVALHLAAVWHDPADILLIHADWGPNLWISLERSR